jgi:hypothetical protein
VKENVAVHARYKEIHEPMVVRVRRHGHGIALARHACLLRHVRVGHIAIVEKEAVVKRWRGFLEPVEVAPLVKKMSIQPALL